MISERVLFCKGLVMLFNSSEFLVFFPIVVICYFLIPSKSRWIWLLVSSYYFYMCWNPVYIILLLFTTVVTYGGGLILGHLSDSLVAGRRLVLSITILSNLFLLFGFKYLNFFCYSCNYFLQKLSIGFRFPEYNILLPMGISFYCFQAIGYVIDVYRGEAEAEKNFFCYALFVSFFPKLMAGPIERSGNLLPQIKMPHKFSWERVKDGLLLMVWGYFLKLVLADRIAIIVNRIWEDHNRYQGCYIILAVILFAFQIYGDFAGYSIIAQGAAQVLGFRLMDNFNAPYLSGSVSEFWRNWHRSLSGWFRDYVYIPLGGNRKGTLRKYLNLMVVFLISGLWHGAAWNYVIWGGLNGIYQVLEDIWGRFLGRRIKISAKNKFWNLIHIAFTFFLIDFAWLFFRAESMSEAVGLIKSVFTVFNPHIISYGVLWELGLLKGEWFLLAFSVLIVGVVDYMHKNGIHVRAYLKQKSIVIRWCVYLMMLWSVMLLGIYGDTYEASAFIYSKF